MIFFKSKDEGVGSEWNKLTKLGQPTLIKKDTWSGENNETESYSMIETTNPRAGQNGQDPTVLIFRTWRLDDVKKQLREKHHTREILRNL